MSAINPPKIEIKTDGIKTVVKINGEEINKVRGVLFKQEPGDVPIVQIDILAVDMTIDADMIPALPDVFKPFYELKEQCDERK